MAMTVLLGKVPSLLVALAQSFRFNKFMLLNLLKLLRPHKPLLV